MVIHVVRAGDTVWSIARQYGVSPQRILSDNGLGREPNQLVVGQALLILLPAVSYTIQPGDTLYSIGQRFGVPEMTLLQNNPDLVLSPYLEAGRTIAIRFEGNKSREVAIYGFAYPNIDGALLRKTLPFLTCLAVFGYGFYEDGSLLPPAGDQELIDQAMEFRVAPVMLITSLTDDGSFSGELASLLFSDASLQEKVLNQIIATMRRKGYLGLDVDFEYIKPEDGPGFLAFLERARVKLHREGYFLNTDLAPKTSADQPGLLYEAHNYRAIGQISDTVLLMTYEWGYTYGPPMAVAPLDQVRRVVSYAVTEIPTEKIYLGIPNYGYDWRLPFERGVSRATSIGNEFAVQLAARNNAVIQYDQRAQSPWFHYWDRTGAQHEVWFEDVRSIQGKYRLIEEYDLLGGGYWNLMRPFSQNWGYLSANYNIRKIVPMPRG